MNNEIKFVSPFKRLCVTVGNLPTAYMESMSYYECLTYFMKFLENQVIPAINNNSEVVKELQEFVANYFDNLDVQTEIDNKLDEMAESGQLAEIIGQYIELNGVLAFDTVADLIGADNLVSGSFVKTSGFYTYNDGGGAYYRIRNLTNQDSTNNYTLFALTNYDNLVAELIPQYKMSVKQYGAKGNGTSDDTQALQFAITYNTFGTVYFDKGEYLISSPLETYVDNSKQCNIEMEKTTIIKTNENLDCLFELGGLGGNNESVIDRVRYFKGGILNANNCTSGIVINGNAIGIIIDGVEINNFTTYGICVPAGITIYSSDISIRNCYINGKNSSYANYGIYFERPDNKLENLRINAVHTCIYTEAGGQFINNVHGLGIGYDVANWFNNTCFLHIKNGQTNIITNCFADTLQTFVKNETNGIFNISNSAYYSYLSNVDTKLFILEGFNTKCNIQNCTFDLPTPATIHQGIIFNNFDDQTSMNSQNVIIENNTIYNCDKLKKGDLLLKTNKTYNPFWATADTFDTTQWYKVGYLITSRLWHNLDIYIDGYKFNCIFKLERDSNVTYLTLRDSSKTNDNYSITLGVTYNNNDNGYEIYNLYLKQKSGSALKADIELKEHNENNPLMVLDQYLIDAELETVTPDDSFDI